MNLRQNFITQEITHILLGNWADMRKEMQEYFCTILHGWLAMGDLPNVGVVKPQPGAWHSWNNQRPMGKKEKKRPVSWGNKIKRKKWHFQKVRFWAEGNFSLIPWSVKYTWNTMCFMSKMLATTNQHPWAHHPLDACYYSVVDELQLSLYMVSPW